MSQPPEAEQARFQGSFEDLFRSHYPDLYRYALRRCANAQDAEDVVAETFAVAWRRRDDLPGGDQTRLWLFGIARLVRMNLSRSTSRRQRLLGRLRGAEHAQPDGFSSPAIGLDDRVARALSDLSPRDREVLLLTAWEELSAPEIATMLEISPAAVRKRLQRARTRLAHHATSDLPSPDCTTTTITEASR